MAEMVRVLELYSGIGGMHCALKASGIMHKVVAAYDVNTNANKIYRHNFPESSVIDKGIEGITVKAFNDLNVDMILMSPPCQPFTRVGRKQDTQDARTNSFLHMLDLLPKVSKLPSYLLVENVKGFETSQARERLTTTLQQCQYTFQEFLLTPLQFGIPNSRLRYFLIAKRSPLEFGFTTTNEVQSTLPPCAKDWLTYRQQAEEEDTENCPSSEPTRDGPCQCGGYLHRDAANTESESAINELGVSPSANPSVNPSVNPSANLSANTELESEVVNETNSSKEESSDAKRRKLDHSESDGGACLDSKICDTNTNASENTQSSNINNKSTMVDSKTENSVASPSCDTGAMKEAVVGSIQTCDTTSCEANLTSSDCGDIADRTSLAKTVVDSTAKVSAGSGTRHVCLEDYGSNMRQSHENQPQFGRVLKVNHFLEAGEEGSGVVDECVLKDKDLKRFMVMDIVNPCSTKTTCFTKRYGRFMEGAGSIVQGTKDAQAVIRASSFKSDIKRHESSSSWSEEQTEAIRDLGLRYFTPQEIASLMGFPKHFGFPEGLTSRQLYMALGNSLNVHVVSVLLKLMTFNDLHVS